LVPALADNQSHLPHRVYIALGGNLGDRPANLQAALNALQASGHVRVENLSHLYETAPFGYADQPDFLNMALEAATDLDPAALLV
jgi:2-amino-4-hydroxy-6-hydroxymethyldihydropteridine diphosphokinase